MSSEEQISNNGRTTHRVLFQKNKATGEERHFTVYDQKYVEVGRRNLLGEKAFTLNLSILEPWPVRQRYFSWRWLFSTIYFAIAAIVYGVYIFQNPENNALSRLMPFTLLFVLLTLGSLLMFISRSPHVTEFRSRYCGVALVSLLYNNPNKKEFSTFVDDLKNRIVAASATMRMDKHQMLINEITRLERLVKENILTEHIYEQAKKRIPNMKIQSPREAGH